MKSTRIMRLNPCYTHIPTTRLTTAILISKLRKFILKKQSAVKPISWLVTREWGKEGDNTTMIIDTMIHGVILMILWYGIKEFLVGTAHIYIVIKIFRLILESLKLNDGIQHV